MKVKKEYVALAVIIVALALYLMLRSTDKTHYELPKPEPVEKSRINGFVITREGGEVELRLQDDRWIIQPEGYLADQSMVDKMVNAISDFTLTTLVSTSQNYSLYELTDDRRIGVDVFDGERLLKRFYIGKTASTYHHTFVRLDNDPGVYQAGDDIRRVFDADVEKLRDKAVVSLDKDEIIGIRVASGVSSLYVRRTDVAPVMDLRFDEESAPDTSSSGVEDAAQEDSQSLWQTEDGRAADDKLLDRIINNLVNLKCDGYIEGKTKADFTDPIYTLTVEGSTTVSLSIFEKLDERYPAVSSQNDYPFLLPEWKAKQIMKDPDEILGEISDE